MICKQCSKKCETCQISSDFCLVCSNFYLENPYLLDGVCLENCPEKYFGNEISKNCENCSDFCLKCENYNIC